jgi:hypothetical protein
MVRCGATPAITGGHWDDDPLVDHQIRILRASNGEVAFERTMV